MATCPSLENVKLSPEGQKALKNIQSVIKNSEILQKVLVGGTLINVLASDKVIPVAFNVTNTDWEMLAKAVKGVPAIAQNRIEQISGMMTLNTKGKERDFWKAIYQNCSVAELSQ